MHEQALIEYYVRHYFRAWEWRNEQDRRKPPFSQSLVSWFVIGAMIGMQMVYDRQEEGEMNLFSQ